MRHIVIDELRLENGWSKRAENATRAIVEGNDSASDHEDLWRDIKKRLFEIFHGKCWFCETPVARSDNAVDHFRPKGLVSDASAPHKGYAWLSFEPKNFRFACTFCNSRRVDVEHGTAGGKAARFPLMDEHARVYQVDPAIVDYSDLLATIRDETPAILDPCDPEDWHLLGCRRENGSPCPTTEDPDEISRVAASIEVYHLDYEPTCKERHTLGVQLLEKVRDAKDAYAALDKSKPATVTRFKSCQIGIRKMLRMKAPFSGEMIFLLQGQRCERHPWIELALLGSG